MKPSRRLIAGLLFTLLVLAGIAGGFLYFTRKSATMDDKGPAVQKREDGFLYLKIYYPLAEGLALEERRITAGAVTSEAVVGEFLKGPAAMGGEGGGKGHYVPQGARVLGTYQGIDGILYINLSSEFRENFQGDAMAEFLLLRGLYESIKTNLPAVADIKVIIDNREADTLGGHLSLLRPLKEVVLQPEKDKKGG